MGLSICIPTYNRLPYLRRLLDSIFNGFGDYPYEIIIADGGSKDGTIECLKKLEKVTLIEQGELTGSVKAFNACFKLAKYEYIFWPADDFIIFPKVLIKACNLMDKYPEIGLVGPKILESAFGNLPNTELFFSFLVLSKIYIFRNSLLKETNYFDENFKTYAIDDDSCLTVLNKGYTIIFTREMGVIHNRIQDELRTHNKNEMRREEELFQKKWTSLNSKIRKYVTLSLLKRCKLQFSRFLCRGLFRLGEMGLLQPLPERSQRLLSNWYDKFLEECAFFKAKEYQHLQDFYLAQRLPKETVNPVRDLPW